MNIGDRVRITKEDASIEGVVLPSSTPDHLVVKQSGGYNVGIARDGASVTVIEPDAYALEPDTPQEGTQSVVETDPELPTIALVSTGGTIASTVDYRTGAVSPRFDVGDVLRAVPALHGLANYRGHVVANILSENMTPTVWQALAQAVADEIAAGADGVVVMHGTDTMQYTASALAFMLESPVPIVFTGSQRSADRPSSDNVMNAVCAVYAALSDIAEPLVCMHESASDDWCAIHRATRVRKNHTSRRAAFETVGGAPIARVRYPDGQVEIRSGASYRMRESVSLALASDLETNVELVKFTPGANPDRLGRLGDDVRGVVIEGTGLGHGSEAWIDNIADLVAADVPVVMTSQCLDGRVCDRVYETGRDLLAAGVIEAENTLPETALVKLMWLLGNDEPVRPAMGQSLAGECVLQSRPWA